MRVLYWSDGFWPQIGGLGVLGARLTRALSERGHQIAVVAAGDDPAMPARAVYHGIPVHRFPFRAALGRRRLDAFLDVRERIARLRREFRPELVHLAYVGPSALFERSSAGAWPAPRLVTIQQAALPYQEHGPDTVLANALREAERIVFCSASARAETERLVPGMGAGSSVVYNALEPPPLEPGPLPWAPPVLLCIGRVVHDKGFDLALRAFALLADSVPAARMLVVGDGPARPELETLAAGLGIAERVSFRGWIAPADVPAAIGKATIVLVPSRREAFGLVALEAALMARPVVAAACGGLNEVVDDGRTGLLVPPDDAGALADAVAGLLDRPALAAAVGAAARRRALEMFSWERHVSAYDALYRQLGKEVERGAGAIG